MAPGAAGGLVAAALALSTAARPMTLTSAKNPAVKALRRLESRRHRDREGLALVEGVRLFLDAVAAGLEPSSLLVTADVLDADADVAAAVARLPESVVSVAAREVVAAACTTVTPQGIVASVHKPRPPASVPALVNSVLVLDHVTDPGNAGTLIRSAAGFGCDVVVCLGACVDPWGPKALRSAMGGTFRIPVLAYTQWCTLCEALRDRGLVVYAADGGPGATRYFDVDWCQPSALVVGNEANGISDAVRASARAGEAQLVAIPMSAGLESFNAAMAGTVILAESARQRASNG